MVLAKRRVFIDAEIAREREALAEIERAPANGEGVEIARLMVEHVLRQLALELEWLNKLQRTLDR